MSFVKLSEIKEFQVLAYGGFKYKQWDNVNRKMLVADEPTKGYSKRHSLTVNGEDILEVSSAQIGQMLEECLKEGVSDLHYKKFTVATNGKTGMEIRYFINLKRDSGMNSPDPAKNSLEVQSGGNTGTSTTDHPINIDDIPF